MPRRTDIHRILVIGSGPIVIGQAAEFDYSGTQAARALREEGYEVVLVNSNPATIMTDPEIADRTYIEPVTPDYVELVVTDNGKGLPEGGRRSGLANLGRRAVDLGGTFVAERGADGGTCVRWRVPLSDA